LRRVFHIYLDETHFEDAEGNKMLGVGALAVADPVSGDLIERAMSALWQDEDRDPASPSFLASNEKLDRATLHRGTFHASFDSKNAHSPLAREIRADEVPSSDHEVEDRRVVRPIPLVRRPGGGRNSALGEPHREPNRPPRPTRRRRFEAISRPIRRR
jgi:hypothetical protein